MSPPSWSSQPSAPRGIGAWTPRQRGSYDKLTSTSTAPGLAPEDGVETLKATLAGHGLAVTAVVPDAPTVSVPAVAGRLVVDEGGAFPGIGDGAGEAIRHAADRAFLASCPDPQA